MSDVDTARSDALAWQVAARNRGIEGTIEELAAERISGLGCPAAQTAAAPLGAAALHPVALDPDAGRPSSEPLTTPEEIWGHFRHRRDDGCGLQLGEQRAGVVLVALHGDATQWRTWLAGLQPDLRDQLPMWVSANWSPPPAPVRSTGVHVGREAIVAAGEALRPSRSSEPGWVLWSAAPGREGQVVAFKDGRRLHGGLSVTTAGVVPFTATRQDGWRVVHSGVPQPTLLPAWLVAELGGRWKAQR